MHVLSSSCTRHQGLPWIIWKPLEWRTSMCLIRVWSLWPLFHSMATIVEPFHQKPQKADIRNNWTKYVFVRRQMKNLKDQSKVDIQDQREELKSELLFLWKQPCPLLTRDWILFFEKHSRECLMGTTKPSSHGLDLWTCIPFVKSLEVEVINMTCLTCSATWMCWPPPTHPPHFRSSNVSTHRHLKTYSWWWNALDDWKRWIHGNHCHLVHPRAEKWKMWFYKVLTQICPV